MAAFDGDEVEFVILEEGVALATFIVPASMTLASLRKEIHMDSAEICELPQNDYFSFLWPTKTGNMLKCAKRHEAVRTVGGAADDENQVSIVTYGENGARSYEHIQAPVASTAVRKTFPAASARTPTRELHEQGRILFRQHLGMGTTKQPNIKPVESPANTISYAPSHVKDEVWSTLSPLIGDELTNGLRAGTVPNLDLKHNNIGNTGACALAHVLKWTTTLIEVDLSFNYNIFARGGKALADALKYNKSLKFLWMQGNSIGDDGAKAMISMLKKNNTLSFLDLQRNDISKHLVLQLEEAARVDMKIAV